MTGSSAHPRAICDLCRTARRPCGRAAVLQKKWKNEPNGSRFFNSLAFEGLGTLTATPATPPCQIRSRSRTSRCEAYAAWFTGNVGKDHAASGTPWTRYGWTYDWAADADEPPYGASEFMLAPGTDYEIAAVQRAAVYCERVRS